jgi:transcriptional regulator with XRE-family HTH domain
MEQLTDTEVLRRHIAGRLALRRLEMNLTRQELGARLACTTEVVELWESGRRRIDALTLWQIAAALNISVGYFFVDEGPADAAPEAFGPRGALVRASRSIEPESITLAGLFQSIRNEDTKSMLLDLISSIAARSQ